MKLLRNDYVPNLNTTLFDTEIIMKNGGHLEFYIHNSIRNKKQLHHAEKWLSWASCWIFMLAPFPNLLVMPLATSGPNFMLLAQNAHFFYI